ncbi:MAG: hypothetical protein ACK48N_01010, partial [Planctomyces sp.]
MNSHRAHRINPRRAALRAAILGLATLAGVPAMALAQGTLSMPARSATTADNFEVEFNTGLLSFRDKNGSARELIVPDYSAVTHRGPVNSIVTIEPADAGFDMRVTFTNTTGAAQEFPRLILARFDMGMITWWDFRNGSTPRTFSPTGREETIHVSDYPADNYSPVLVFGDTQHTIGISAIYDVIGYDQSVRMMLGAVPQKPGQHGAGLRVYINADGLIPAGATRSYRYAIRVARAGEAWLSTLEPYREHFRATFGGVRYSLDRRPVTGRTMAEASRFTPDNPRAFVNDTLRPDRFGYGPWVETLRRDAPNRNYKRLMIWAPAGMFMNNRHLNFPSRLFSGVRGIPMMENTVGELARIPGPNLEVGYYWGYPTLVMPSWDQDIAIPFDVSNSDHVAWGYYELDQAVRLGATMVGLDAFVIASPATQYRWLSALSARAPGVKFLVELSGADFLHTMAANFYTSNLVTGPDILAHYLLPGHESWASIRFDVIERETGRRATEQEKAAEFARVADAGFVPLDFAGATVPEGMLAANVYTSVIPSSLRLSPAPPRMGFNPQVAQPTPNWSPSSFSGGGLAGGGGGGGGSGSSGGGASAG